MSASGLKDIRLSFQTEFGLFVIESKSAMKDMVALKLELPEKPIQTLGHYYQINDAIVAVVQQQSGCEEWDSLAMHEVPYRIFDITCWKRETTAVA